MATGYILVDSPNPYTAQGVYPRRGGARLSGTCIVHTSEGAWTAGVDSLTSLVRRRADYGCYHRACDWQDIALYYPWEWECWQDSETNNWAAGIAAACRTTDWNTMPADIAEGFYRNMAKMGADFVRYMKATYNITVPLRRISGAEARARVPGFCAHGDSGIGRSDPGRDFDWARFFRYMAELLAGTHVPPKEDKVLIIATAPEENGKTWIGDGLHRRHIPSPKVLQDYQNVAGLLKIHDNGRVQQLPAEVLGLDLAGEVKRISDTAKAAVLEALKATPGVDDSVAAAVAASVSSKLDEKFSTLSITLEAKATE